MNKVILMGRLTRDPDIRHSQGENSMMIARYTLAVDRRRSSAGGDREADFISCTAFGRQAEFAEKYLHQGTKIAITGRIQTGSYQNKEGQRVYTTDVIVEDQEFAESKAAQDNRASYSQRSEYRPQASGPEQFDNAPRRGDYSEAAGEGFINIPEGVEDEGLPFNTN